MLVHHNWTKITVFAQNASIIAETRDHVCKYPDMLIDYFDMDVITLGANFTEKKENI